MAKTEKKCDSLFWRAARAKHGSNCKAKGQGAVECYGDVQVHHVGYRWRNSCRFELDLAIELCGDHTSDRKFSAHGTPKKFIEWFGNKYPERYMTLCERRNLIIPDYEMDYDAIYAELLAEIRKEVPGYTLGMRVA